MTDEGYNVEDFSDGKEVADEVESVVDQMMAVNSEIIDKARRTAKMYLEIQELHLDQAARAHSLAQLIAIGAKLAADLAGDLITAQYDLGELLFDEYGIRGASDEDDEEGEEGDDEQ